jgi:hypothetical protein
MSRAKKHFICYVGSACPFLHTFHCPHTGFFDCWKMNNDIWEIVRDKRVETVILSSYWAIYYHINVFDNQVGHKGENMAPSVEHHINIDLQEGGATPDITHNCVPTLNAQFSKTALMQEYLHVIETLLNLGKKVVLVYQVPEIGWNAKVKVNQNQVQGVKDDLTVSYELVKQRNRDLTDAFDKIKHPNLSRIYPEKVLCSTQTNRCRVQNGSINYYLDSHHLNYENAVALFEDVFRQALKL